MEEKCVQILTELASLNAPGPEAQNHRRVMRDRLFTLCYPLLEDEIKKITVDYCRHRFKADDGHWRGAADYEAFYGDVFMYIWEKKFEGENFTRFFSKFPLDGQGHFVPWFRRSVRNACLDWFRRPVRVRGERTGLSQAQLIRQEGARTNLDDVIGLTADQQADAEGVVRETKESSAAGSSDPSTPAASLRSVEFDAPLAISAGSAPRDYLGTMIAAMGRLRVETQAALCLFFCAILPIPDKVVEHLVAVRKATVERVQAEIEEIQRPLKEKLTALVDSPDREIIAAQDLLAEQARRRIEDLTREAQGLGIDFETLDKWRVACAGQPLKQIRADAEQESSTKRRYLRWEYQRAWWSLHRAERKIAQIEKRQQIPTPTYRQLASVIGLTEAGATARVLRGKEKLRRILAELDPPELRSA
ncbi:MAG: hypothetical protein KAY32_09845 [Candidatus Eisenbacteria sp.]|nr:hypothetical protein [Candidatus Eisenbacteria bacterium]